MNSGSETVAFFDVDETLIAVKSMFEFRRYWLARQGDDGAAFSAEWETMRARVRQGVVREEINRAYYRGFAGVPSATLREVGRQWYADYRIRTDAFITSTLRALARHREEGHQVVLVSGSFQPVLAPVAREVSADHILCTEPLVDSDGVLTGEVVRPMIGEAKGAAVAGYVQAHQLDPGTCYAYADHRSDLAMLRTVGWPRVVGADPVLLAQAALGNWTVLSGAAGPLAAADVPELIPAGRSEEPVLPGAGMP